ILVRVRAVSLRFYDGGMLEGGLGRLLFGLRKPKNTTPGLDFAGTVEAVGGNVTEFKPGDEVFGVRAGALAAYVCFRQAGAIALKPRTSISSKRRRSQLRLLLYKACATRRE